MSCFPRGSNERERHTHTMFSCRFLWLLADAWRGNELRCAAWRGYESAMVLHVAMHTILASGTAWWASRAFFVADIRRASWSPFIIAGKNVHCCIYTRYGWMHWIDASQTMRKPCSCWYVRDFIHVCVCVSWASMSNDRWCLNRYRYIYICIYDSSPNVAWQRVRSTDWATTTRQKGFSNERPICIVLRKWWWKRP